MLSTGYHKIDFIKNLNGNLLMQTSKKEKQYSFSEIL